MITHIYDAIDRFVESSGHIPKEIVMNMDSLKRIAMDCPYGGSVERIMDIPVRVDSECPPDMLYIF